MNYQDYLMQVKSRLPNSKTILLDDIETTVAYEEIFKLEWLATKLKIFSFIAYTKTVNKNQLENYSSACLKYARKNIKGLPIGLQNGILSNNILVAESISDDAISFVTSRPQKHYCVFEMPIIFDLTKNELYCYKGEIIWGMIYNSFIHNYIKENFIISG